VLPFLTGQATVRSAVQPVLISDPLRTGTDDTKPRRGVNGPAVRERPI